jgi:hypothetical protein
MQERPALIWLSFYERTPLALHKGTIIVEAGSDVLALQIVRERGLAPVDCDVATQGLSQDSVPFYRAHLDQLMDDQALIAAFGEAGVLCQDKRTLGEAIEQQRRKTYRPPAIERSETMAGDYCEDSLPIVELPFVEHRGGGR